MLHRNPAWASECIEGALGAFTLRPSHCTSSQHLVTPRSTRRTPLSRFGMKRKNEQEVVRAWEPRVKEITQKV